MDREEERRNELLDRGMVLFFMEGISAFTMEGLAARLGVSKRTLYKYYPKKELFVDAAAQRMLDKVRGQIEAHLATESEFPQRLKGFFMIVQTTLQPAARLLVRDIMTAAPWLWEKVSRYRHDKIFSLLEGLLDEGRAKGYIRSDIEPRLITPLFIGMIEQVAQPAFLLNLPFGVSEVIDAISSMLLGGILSEAGRQMFLSSKAAGITISPAATGHEKGVSP